MAIEDRSPHDVDLSEDEFWRLFLRCFAIGFPAAFLMVFLLCLPHGVAAAAGIASVPTVFGGWYVGSVWCLTRVQERVEREARAVTTTTTEGDDLACGRLRAA